MLTKRIGEAYLSNEYNEEVKPSHSTSSKLKNNALGIQAVPELFRLANL